MVWIVYPLKYQHLFYLHSVGGGYDDETWGGGGGGNGDSDGKHHVIGIINKIVVADVMTHE